MSRTLVALLVALALIAAACGSAHGNPSSGADSREVDVEAALLAFAQCMRDEGFEIEDPTVDADGNVHLPSPAGAGEGEGHASTEELQEAARGACGEYLEGVTQTAEHGDDTDQLDSMLAFAQCMRDQGVDFDDPDPSAPGRAFGGGLHQLDRNDPAVQAALEVCQPELYGEDHG
jgi:hypothetical protein